MEVPHWTRPWPARPSSGSATSTRPSGSSCCARRAGRASWPSTGRRSPWVRRPLAGPARSGPRAGSPACHPLWKPLVPRHFGLTTLRLGYPASRSKGSTGEEARAGDEGWSPGRWAGRCSCRRRRGDRL